MRNIGYFITTSVLGLTVAMTAANAQGQSLTVRVDDDGAITTHTFESSGDDWRSARVPLGLLPRTVSIRVESPAAEPVLLDSIAVLDRTFEHVYPLAGVAFTGSTEVALHINRALAARDSAIATLIAETGGQNAMIVDSSALPEQVVLDTVKSAFNSAGQRCSALRVLFLQEEIAERTLRLLKGFMQELRIGDPALLSTDVGPVIDAEALAGLEAHVARLEQRGSVLARCHLPASAAYGTFLAPVAAEIGSIGELEGEVFGPVLHVVRYAARDLDRVIAEINATGFALTLGVHSRIDARAREVFAKARAGNVYVNRNMVGAVVGVQPFGGSGLSGTGPKAGGPGYLHRFMTERTLTINTSAVGGNASLLSLSEG